MGGPQAVFCVRPPPASLEALFGQNEFSFLCMTALIHGTATRKFAVAAACSTCSLFVASPEFVASHNIDIEHNAIHI